MPITSTSISVPMKQRKASSGVQTIGSPRTLKQVFTSTGQPVRALERLRSESWKGGLVSACTVWTRAE